VLLLVSCASPLPEVIKIGLVAPFEGQYRALGYDAIYAARLAVREINAAGGVAGWKLELVAYDDRADVEMARTAARNLVIDPDVVAVIGHYRQASTAEAYPVYAEAGLPLLVVGGWLTDTCELAWHIAPAPERVAGAMVSIEPDASTRTAVVLGKGPLLAPLDAEVQARAYHRPALSSLPDLLFSTLSPVETAEHLVAWRDEGWQGVLIGGADLATTAFAQVAGEAATGTYFVTPYPFPQDQPELADWVTAYQAVGPHVPSPGLYALPTYEAVYVLADVIASAVKTTGMPTRDSLVATLPDVRHTGALSEIAWDEDGFLRNGGVYVYRWENGSPELVRHVR